MSSRFDSPLALRKAVISGAITGALLAPLLFGGVVLTGNTFGQRCAVVYPKGSAAWGTCVQRLQSGGAVEATVPARRSRGIAV